MRANTQLFILLCGILCMFTTGCASSVGQSRGYSASPPVTPAQRYDDRLKICIHYSDLYMKKFLKAEVNKDVDAMQRIFKHVIFTYKISGLFNLAMFGSIPISTVRQDVIPIEKNEKYMFNAISPKIDFGAKPKNVKQCITHLFDEILFDPASAQIKKISKIEKGYLFDSKDTKEIFYGWTGSCLVNAKNRMGGYTGFSQLEFIIYNDKIIYHALDDD